MNDRWVGGVLGWEHRDLPRGTGRDARWVGWSADPAVRSERHLARRHQGVANVLGLHGDVSAVREGVVARAEYAGR